MPLRRLISFHHLKRCYERSPLWLRSAYAMIPFSTRMGTVYRQTRQLIKETDFASRAEILALQADRLRPLVRHAYDHVAYYRQAMDNAGLRPDDIHDVGDLPKMPLVSKQLMRERSDQFVATGGLAEKTYWDNTGGSTGVPFRFLAPNSAYPIETAYILAQWERVGYTPRERRLTLRGRQVDPSGKGQRFRFNPIYNELQLSTYHIDAETVMRLLPVIERFRPTFLYGYPTAIALFLKTIRENNIQLPSPIVGALCGSEPLFDYQRDLIRETLGCRAYSWFGQSEKVCLAGECEKSTSYHCFPTYGITELVDDRGEPITSPGIEGEIVATSLYNCAMPFIRYRTGDRAVFDTFDTCDCGRNHVRLKNIRGRTQDVVYTRSGRAVPVTAIVFGQHFAAFANMHGMQLYQETAGELIVRILKGPGFSLADEEEIRSTMEGAVDGDLCVAFEYPSGLATTDSGKSPFVIQKTPVER